METLTEKNEKGGKMSKEEKTYNAAQAMAGNIIADFIYFHIKRDNTKKHIVERLWDSWDVFIDDEIWENSERSFFNGK
tara:strand:+ start:214 stop:447 length:234 start_codon:yes stop_codon:yes gene_type:complete